MKKIWSLLSILLAVMLMMSGAFAEVAEPAAETEDAVVEQPAEETAAPAEETTAPAEDSENPDGVVTDHGGIDHKEFLNPKTHKVIVDKNGDPITDEKTLCKYSPVIARVFYKEVLADGNHYYEDEVLRKDHVWKETKDTATCTKGGTKTFVCENCGETKTEPSEALGHLWSSEVDGPSEWGRITKEATCYEEGEAIDFCVRCGETGEKTRPIEKIDHNFKEVVVKIPACYNEKKDGVVPEEDRYSETWPNGYQVWYIYGESVEKCSVCGEVKEDSTKKLTVADYVKLSGKKDYDGHDWDAWVPELDTTCTKDGRDVRWCKHCGVEQHRTIAAWNHSTNEARDNMKLLGDPIEKHITDCFTRYNVYKCSECGKEFKGMFVDGKFVEGTEFEVESHVFPAAVTAAAKKGSIDAATYEKWLKDESEILVGKTTGDDRLTTNTVKFNSLILSSEDPTCTEDGEIVIKCVYYDENSKHDEDDTIKLVVKAPGHQWDPEGGNGWVIEHEKNENGNEFAHWVRTCLVCGKTEDFNGNYSPEKCPEGAHDFEEVSRVEATCTEDGAKALICTICGEPGEEVIPAAGHKWDDGVVTEPTCDEAGYTTFTCTECGETRTEAGAEATGHDYVKEVVTEPSCKTGTAGKYLYTCTKCGDIYIETVPAPEHVVVVDAAVEPQIGVDGLTEGSHCEVCGEVIVAQEIIPAIIENEYAVDLSDVTADGANVDGIAKVDQTAGTAPAEKMWARVSHTWEDEAGFTYGAVTLVPVESDMTFVMPSYSGYEDMTLTNVTVVLVNDRAGRAGAYAPYAISKVAKY